MKWTLDEPKFGDIIRIKLGSIYHLGIYVNDDEVIQFGLPPTSLIHDASKVKVCSTSVEEFLCGNFLEVGMPDKQEKKKMRSPKEIVKIAKSRIGQGGYHILYNNCEHFVNECVFGIKSCEQVDNIRNMWQNFALTHVYVKKFPFPTSNDKIYPKERMNEIKSCGNKDVQDEKYFSWKLLECALQKSLGKNIKDCHLYKKDNKWMAKECELSISHSNNLVAVVISKKPVGVDIEKIDPERFSRIPYDRILTENELNNSTESFGEALNKIWTIKEALFKKCPEKIFNPAKVETLNEKYVTKIIEDGESNYYLTIASDDCSFTKFFVDDGLIIK